jgi:hypothetical protein
MCYILCMCVCGASDSTTASDDPSSSDVCVVCIGIFPRGFPGGGRYAPPTSYTQRLATGVSPGLMRFEAAPRKKKFGAFFFYF